MHFLWPVALDWVSLLHAQATLFTCVSFLLLYLVHLLVLPSRIKLQQSVSENGNLKGVSYKEGNKWKRNAHHKFKWGGGTV